MELKNLKQHVRTLIKLPATEAPVVSCYQSVTEGRLTDQNAFTERMRVLRQGLRGKKREDFDVALEQIDKYISTDLLPEAKGIAIFSRAGDEPFFLPLQFRVPSPDWIALDSTPNIYHLIELKDTYHRYVVMIATEKSVRIIQVNMGSVTAQLWNHRPALRERVGREWTKSHFQKHLNQRNRKFIKEAIKILESLMSTGNYSHLLLAGNSSMASQIERELPKHLKEKLVDTVPASGATPLSEVIDATLESFVEAEEQESQVMASDLLEQLRTGGLAVVGTNASFQAVYSGQADVLVIAKQYEPGQGWACDDCGKMNVESTQPPACPDCGGQALRHFDIKEQLVRHAEELACTVEVVNQSDELVHLGGVGCLLRYRLPVEYA